MEITINKIIKMLPFEEEFKIHLLENLEKYDPDQKHDIEDLLWDLYMQEYRLQLEKNTHLALYKAKNGQEKLDKDFYKRIEEQTEKEMEKEFFKSGNEVDLSAARKAMEKIIHEINAAKEQ